MTRFALILAAVVAVAHADPIVWTGDPTSFWDEAEDRSAGALATDTGMIIGATCNATDLNGCFLEFTADRLFTVTSTDSFYLSTVIPASLFGLNCAIDVTCFEVASETSELSGSTSIFASAAGPSGFVVGQSL